MCTPPLFSGNQDHQIFSHHDTCQEQPAPSEPQIGPFPLLLLTPVFTNSSAASLPGRVKNGFYDWRHSVIQPSLSGFSADKTVASQIKPKHSVHQGPEISPKWGQLGSGSSSVTLDVGGQESSEVTVTPVHFEMKSSLSQRPDWSASPGEGRLLETGPDQNSQGVDPCRRGSLKMDNSFRQTPC